MDIKKLQSLVIEALEDMKAQDIHVYDTTHLTSMFDRIAIASGTSNRQTKSLAASVRDKVKEAGGHIVSMEGEGTGEWVLVDLGDMIVHIMQPAIRAYYRLEEIWGEKEVKFGAAKRISSGAARGAPVREPGRHLVKASEPMPTETKLTEKKAAATSPRKPASKVTSKTATKTATKTAARPASKVAPKKVASKLATKTASKTASKTTSKTAGKPASKTASKTTARKTPAKSVTKIVIKKAAAKTPAKKAAKKAAPKRRTTKAG